MARDFQFYPTPDPFTEWLFEDQFIAGRIAAPCVGGGAIISVAERVRPSVSPRTWVRNDIDPRWPADHHLDARGATLWKEFGPVDWTVDNPPFEGAIDIIDHALKASAIGVAMHLRLSFHEPLKTGAARAWLNEHPPAGLLILPRFAYQRSKKTGEWSTDSVCACWTIWRTPPYAGGQFIRYAPPALLTTLKTYTPTYRTEMDRLMATRRAST